MRKQYINQRHQERVQAMARRTWYNENSKPLALMAIMLVLWIAASSIEFNTIVRLGG